MSEREEIIGRVDEALAEYRKSGPSVPLAIDLAAALREARELVTAEPHDELSDAQVLAAVHDTAIAERIAQDIRALRSPNVIDMRSAGVNAGLDMAALVSSTTVVRRVAAHRTPPSSTSEACEADRGPEGQESPCRYGEWRSSDSCPHENFTSHHIGRGMVRMTCHDCGETTEAHSATAQADIDERSTR